MHADVTHLCLWAVYLPYELNSGMTRQARGDAALSLRLNNQQCQAVNVPENERFFDMLFLHWLTRTFSVTMRLFNMHYSSQVSNTSFASLANAANSRTYCTPENINLPCVTDE